MDRRTWILSASTAPLWYSVRELLARDVGTEMLVHSLVPHNAEPRLADLVQQWITPTERFYVRSHAPVPKLDPAAFRLQLDGHIRSPLSWSLGELKEKFPQTTVTATMTCAGNRRSEHSLIQPVAGVQWQAGAIGNATWTGVRLSDVLKHAAVKPEARHVWFEGLDAVDRPNGVIPFGASIPLSKAMAESGEVLLASAMNGQPLTPDHGFPLRTVVPGFIGARSVKWLGKIVVSDRPSPNHYVATAYKLVQSGTADEWATSAPLETYVTNSVVCIPSAGTQVVPGRLAVRGYALAAGAPGLSIRRVEVSADGGQTWTPAKFDREAQPYCWRLWSVKLSVRPTTKALIVRAIDSNGESQPETVEWNLKGYQFNAWHRTPVHIPGSNR